MSIRPAPKLHFNVKRHRDGGMTSRSCAEATDRLLRLLLVFQHWRQFQLNLLLIFVPDYLIMEAVKVESMDCRRDVAEGKQYWMAIKRRYPIEHEFFVEGDVVCCGSNAKYLAVDIDQEEYLHNTVSEFSCSIASCMTTFSTIHDYEWHYNNVHRHVCKDCKKLFPTDYLLERHVLESHDTLFRLMAQKHNMYKCLVEKCEFVLKDFKERKHHMINEHKFPPNFRFGSFSQNNMDSKPIKSASKKQDNGESSEMEIVSTSTASTSNIIYAPKIPKTICFGYGTTKGFLPKRGSQLKGKSKVNWHQKKSEGMDTSVNIENVKLNDLMDSLPPPTN